ncbi:MAG: hypothetical protein KGL26_11810 [Pseudomonadota bacterium]|nr:hypothetical protein [Pseudomonadota bacterium]
MSAAKKKPEPVAEEVPLGELRPDGSLVISAEQLERVWPGDAKWARKQLRLLLADLKTPKPIMRPTAHPGAHVRPITPMDELGILELLRLGHEESFKHIGPMNQRKVEELIMAASRAKGGLACAIDGADGLPVATAGLQLCQWYSSEQWFLQEVWNFVHPDHRRSSHAADLLAWEKWCGDNFTERFGYEVYVVGGVTSPKKQRQKVRLFGRHVNMIGATFIYPLPPGAEP